MKQLGLIFFALVGISLGWLFSAIWKSYPGQAVGTAMILPVSPTPTPVPYYQPLRLRIPALEVDTQVESVGLDERGAMDVPKLAENVAWYNLGAKPGETGSSVLAGHYDWYDGPAVFYRLADLQPGDVIEVEDIYGKTVTFEVKRTENYEESEFPLGEVFGSRDGARLNLITCSGSYDRREGNYSHRLVVYAEKIN